MNKIRVLVVDDSLFMRKVIEDLLNSDSSIEVVGLASNGNEAIEQVAKLNPDVITLDYEMPQIDGLEVLNKLKDQPYHPRVIMVSGFTDEDAKVTLQCLSAGAIDFVKKPSGALSFDMAKVREELVGKVKMASQVNPKLTKSFQEKLHRISSVNFSNSRNYAIVIGSSTGGPVALEALLPLFPENFPYPIFVNQHMPEMFTKTFAKRLDNECLLRVVEGENGQKVSTGMIYVAPGNHDMSLRKDADGSVYIVTTKTTEIQSPSVNTLMTSVANVYGSATIGIILTGMGNDGLKGMEEIKKHGGKTIVQDENSSAVYGMGREVVVHGLADHVVPLDQIMDKIMSLIN